MIADLLFYLVLPVGGLSAVGAAFVFLTPWGPAALTLVANSKVARIALGTAGIALAAGLGALKAFNAGKASARVDVEDANRAAAAERRTVERKAEGETDEALRKELGRWGSR